MDYWTGEILYCIFKAVVWSVIVSIFNDRLNGWIFIWVYYGIKIMGICNEKERCQAPPKEGSVPTYNVQTKKTAYEKKSLRPYDLRVRDYMTIDEEACKEFGCDIPPEDVCTVIRPWAAPYPTLEDFKERMIKKGQIFYKTRNYFTTAVGAGTKVSGPVMDQKGTYPWEILVTDDSYQPIVISFLDSINRNWVKNEGYRFTEHLKAAKQYHESRGEKFIYDFDEAYKEALTNYENDRKLASEISGARVMYRILFEKEGEIDKEKVSIPNS